MEEQADRPGAPAVEPALAGEESSLFLLRRAQEGNQDALDQLCDRYLPRLRRWASGRLPSYARGLLDTDDLVQESFLRTIRRIGHLRPARSASLHAYFHQTILNQIRRQAERAWRRRSLGDSSGVVPAPDPSPLEVTMGQEAVARYEMALATLNRKDRELILLRVELGCQYSELANVLGKASPDAARVAVGRALVRLGKEMANGRRTPWR